MARSLEESQEPSRALRSKIENLSKADPALKKASNDARETASALFREARVPWEKLLKRATI